MNVVTGAFGYIGRYIARRLLESGEAVRTITTHPEKPNPFGSTVEGFPSNFDQPDELVAHLRGAAALYNTYWIRFERGRMTFQQAVQNTITLFECARKAGVGKIIHISVTNASLESRLPYYRGKIKPSVKLIRVPPAIGIALGRAIRLAVRDVILTKEELQGLMDSLLTSGHVPNGRTRFTEWFDRHRDEIGLRYVSELGRHFRRCSHP